MLKRKPILFFALLFAIVALFAASEVMAQNLCSQGDCPNTCTTDNGFTIKLAPGFPIIIAQATTIGDIKYTCDPEDDTAGPCKIWAWDFIAGSPTDVAHVVFNMPVCCTTQVQVISGDPDTPQVFEPCSRGDNVLYFGQYACDNYTIVMTSQVKNSSQNRFWMATNVEAVPGNMSMVFKVGNKKYPCISYDGANIAGGIVGPDCPPQQEVPTGALATRKCIRVGEGDYLGFLLDLTTGCPYENSLALHHTDDCTDTGTPPQTPIPATSDYCVTPGLDVRCPSCAEYFTGSSSPTATLSSFSAFATASTCSCPTPDEFVYRYYGYEYRWCTGQCVETICDDGVDNDSDGATDCADTDCTGDPACP
jgi:hypothetical protein